MAHRPEFARHRRAGHLSTVKDLLADIDAAADPATAEFLARYFKLEPGSYGFGDQMIGVKLSALRTILKPYGRADLSLASLEEALSSQVHEHRLAVLCLLADRAMRALKPRTANPAELAAIYDLYLRTTDRVNNWDLVDCSASEIVGGYLADTPRDDLYTLIRSSSLWERRIALVATHYFMRYRNDATDIYALAPLVFDDPEDLIHKATGWMLREAGKRVSAADLRTFLDAHAPSMPRTALRYAIEHLPPETRRHYLSLPRTK